MSAISRGRRYSHGDVKIGVTNYSHGNPALVHPRPSKSGSVSVSRQNSADYSERSNPNSARSTHNSARSVTPVRRKLPPSTLARANSFGAVPQSKKKRASVFSFSLSKDQEELETELLKKRSKAMRSHPGPDARELRTKFPKKRISSDLDKMSIVTNNIVLGSKRDAANKILMEKLGITHILNMAQQVPNHHPNDFIYHKISILDAPTTDITESYAAASSFMSRVEKVKGRVLVHCVSGVSRSVSVVIMHFIGKYRMHLKHAYNHIYAVRPYIHPNNGFKFQMAMFELEYQGTSSIVGPNSGEAWNFYEWNSVKALYRHQSVDGSEGIERSFYSVCCTVS